MTARSPARSAAMMALGSVLGRATGFARTAAIGVALGAHLVNDDYTLANNLPNMVYELLVGGVLASVVVPMLVRARTRDPDAGQAFTDRLLSLTVVLLAVAATAATAAAPLLTRLINNSDASPTDSRLITMLGYLLLPEVFFYGVAAVITAVLNARGVFAAPAWMPIANNIVVIATAGVFLLIPTSGELTPATITTTGILVLGIGTTAGIVVQSAGVAAVLRRTGFRWRWRWDWRQLGLRELARAGGWILAYVVINQIALTAILRTAKTAGAAGPDIPGPAIFNNAYLVLMMAHGVVAVSIMTVLMPRMAEAAATNRPADVAEYLSRGTRLTALILVPAGAGYLLLGREIGVTLFSWGRYPVSAGVQTGWVIAAAGLALVPFAISQFQIFALYALPDARTPALLNVPVAALRVAIAVAALYLLPARWVVVGIMVAHAVSFVVAMLLGGWALRRRLGPLGSARTLAMLAKISAATLAATVPAALVAFAVTRLLGPGKVGSMVCLLTAGATLAGAFLFVASRLRLPEVVDLTAMVRSRLRPR
ncbi:murein biosynthesis integral membrane protein MurJ [Longispora sp. K20-0274]|uniref:murein biosynthesis integral membrane protein MurJ n=1 Tax=Longispora sp. K20-0274 TaxID=3088255 RepID=UPI00399A5F15